MADNDPPPANGPAATNPVTLIKPDQAQANTKPASPQAGGDQFGNGAPLAALKARGSGILDFMWNTGGKISWLLVGIGALIAYICISIIGENSIIGKLSDPAVARGFLTYVIVLAFVGMIFMLAYQAFIAGVEDDQFRRAREIFTSLTGVLGTIVGFHFGIESSAKTLEVIPRITQEQYIAHVTTGTAPYTYSLRSEPAGLVEEVREKQSLDGWIMAPLKSAATPGKILLEIKDSKGTSSTQSTTVQGQAAPPEQTDPPAKKPK